MLARWLLPCLAPVLLEEEEQRHKLQLESG